MALSNAPELEQPVRADARRNRAKVLEGARRAFAEEGLEAQIPDIARRAGVGVGTVYRHFPTKAALVEALAHDHFGRMVELARAAREADGDPWESFEALMWDAARAFVADRGLAEIVANQPGTMQAVAADQQELNAIGAELVERAKAAGVMRSDASGADIPTMMCGLSSIVAASTRQQRRPELDWERYLTLMLDGLRAH